MRSEIELTEKSAVIYRLVSLAFGVIAFLIGTINIFWGNDPGFGIFIAMLSLLYIPRINVYIKGKTGRTIPGVIKFFLALFILWAALGVGELFDKIELMLGDLN